MTRGVDPALVAWALGSLVVVGAIGAWAARRTRDARDFFLAGQRIGLWVTGLAAASAAFSGFVFLGGPGLTYRVGVASWFIVLPIGFTPGLLAFAAARTLRRYAEDPDVLTVPDVLRARFRSPAVSGLAAVVVLVGTAGYLGVQVLAAGRLLETVLGVRDLAGGWGLPLSMGLGLVVVLAYATAGGMVAGVYTDVVQAALMIVAAVAVFVFAIDLAGGWDAAVAAVWNDRRFGPGFLDPVGRVPGATVTGFLFVFGLGVLGQPQMLHKFMMIDDPARLRFLPAVLGGAQTLSLLVWIGLGLAIPALVAGGRMPPPTSSDEAVPLFLAAVAPAALAGLAVAGVLAAILSTSDSLLNLAAAALTRDLPRALGRPASAGIGPARIATAAVGLLAGALAWWQDDLIALLGTFAFGSFAAGLAPVVAVGLSWGRVSARVAAASISTGIGLHLGLEAWARLAGGGPLAEGALPSAAALAASTLVVLVGGWCFPARPAAGSGVLQTPGG